MNINVLLTGGRAPATLHLARLLAHNACRVFVADSIDVYLCQSSNAIQKAYRLPKPRLNEAAYVKALIEIIQKEDIDLLIPTCEETFYIAKAKPLLSRHCRVLTDDFDTLHRLHNKWTFNRLLEPSGHVHAPASYRIRSASELKRRLQKLDHPAVLKPVYSRFGTDVLFLKPGDRNRDIDFNREWILQAYVEGVQICSYTVAVNGKMIAHSTYETRYRVGTGATVHFEYRPHENIDAFVQSFVNRFRYTGQIAFDFIETNDGRLFPIECNPRLTSGIHLFDEKQPFALEARNANVQRPDRPGKRVLLLPFVFQLLQRSPLHWIRELKGVRDVVFVPFDPKPFFYQAPVLVYLLGLAVGKRKNMLKITTDDIEWGDFA